jgi:flagellar protein FliT
MMLNNFLQKSAFLYKFLVEVKDDVENRSKNIEIINRMLAERGEVVEQLRVEGFQFDEKNTMHKTLLELDKGIREKLDDLMDSIKNDMKELQRIKKYERQYIDPYEDIRQLNARYFDGKK